MTNGPGNLKHARHAIEEPFKAGATFPRAFQTAKKVAVKMAVGQLAGHWVVCLFVGQEHLARFCQEFRRKECTFAPVY